ncbi:hypothetical protein FBR05_01240 [Deltaproteobacteria bacterium PRO3]|nr:hypothetical protein [Deltaproteobacteria bacterium PRO3]
MKYSIRWYLLALSFLFPLSLQAKTDEARGQEKVCFCHNVNHNPHTICTANPALIQAHMDHVNGEVPGVMDSLGECESEPDPSDVPDDGDDGEEGEGDPGEETPEDEGDTPEKENPDDSEGESGNAGDGDVPDNAQVLDDGETGATGGGALTFMEGSGCSLNPTATGSAGGALVWGLMATLPLWRMRRR